MSQKKGNRKNQSRFKKYVKPSGKTFMALAIANAAVAGTAEFKVPKQALKIDRLK
ncbi:hypothetical protein [Lysinibacillus sp. NPDC086135]|uniref:hypothetical protein n=1 Tax=Lysinibacillus sp. NPDC086135 TaxID=3364130 RepID=UPI0037FF867E